MTGGIYLLEFNVTSENLLELNKMEEERDGALEAKNEAVRALGELRNNWNNEMFRELGKVEAFEQFKQDAQFRVEMGHKEIRLLRSQIEKMERASWWKRLWKTW